LPAIVSLPSPAAVPGATVAAFVTPREAVTVPVPPSTPPVNDKACVVRPPFTSSAPALICDPTTVVSNVFCGMLSCDDAPLIVSESMVGLMSSVIVPELASVTS
jgi:hypothetical protein